MENPEEYIKLFDDWIDKGNRLLKRGDKVFLPIMMLRMSRGVLVYVYDNAQNTYSGWVTQRQFGEMITEKIPRTLLSLGIKPMPLHDFAKNLISSNSRQSLGRTILFSFDQIDTEQLPGWIVEELVRQKLSK